MIKIKHSHINKMEPANDDQPPKVSVIMPIYNAGRYLKVAVESLLNQTFIDFELLAIDDCSTDGSLDLLQDYKDYRIRILKNEKNLGQGLTRNRGLEEARGVFVAFMDNDDVSHPDRLKRQVEYLDLNPAVAVVGSWARIIDADGKPIRIWEHPAEPSEVKQAILSFCPVINPSVMARRVALIEAGGYQPGMTEDYPLWLSIAERHSIANIPETLIDYRVHVSQLSLRKLALQVHASNRVRRSAIERWRQLDILPRGSAPAVPSLWDELRCKENTVARAYLYWSTLYKEMGQDRQAAMLAFRAFLRAPLGAQSRKAAGLAFLSTIFSSKRLNAMRWYRQRLRSLIRRS